MSFSTKPLRRVAKSFLAILVMGLLSLGIGLEQPAYADNSQTTGEYIAADGSDLTAVALCLPKELSQPSLKRALRESGNDFLQKVFSVKEDYTEYKLDQPESEYLDCLKSKGVVSQVER
mgnify:CR=1 FL=1|jgi:hypothetical protein